MNICCFAVLFVFVALANSQPIQNNDAKSKTSFEADLQQPENETVNEDPSNTHPSEMTTLKSSGKTKSTHKLTRIKKSPSAKRKHKNEKSNHNSQLSKKSDNKTQTRAKSKEIGQKYSTNSAETLASTDYNAIQQWGMQNRYPASSSAALPLEITQSISDVFATANNAMDTYFKIREIYCALPNRNNAVPNAKCGQNLGDPNEVAVVQDNECISVRPTYFHEGQCYFYTSGCLQRLPAAITIIISFIMAKMLS